MRVRRCLFMGMALLLAACALVAHAQDNDKGVTENNVGNHKAPEEAITAVKATSAPDINGPGNETFWKASKPAMIFIQREPHEGEPASVQTQVRLACTKDGIYFRITCFDSEP